MMAPRLLKKLPLSGAGTVVLLTLLTFATGCNRRPEIQPRYAVPGYDASLLVEETFDESLSNWVLDGHGRAEITENRRLLLTGASDTAGIDLVLWLKSNVDDSFLIEYDIEFPETPVEGALLFCAQDAEHGNLEAAAKTRQGATVPWGEVLQAYEISMHCYTDNGSHDPGSKLKKYPGPYLLAKSIGDPCEANRDYLVNMAKTGTRIQFFIDGQKVHDLRDRGGFGASENASHYKSGQIGLYLHGAAQTSVLVDNVRIFKLNPR